MDRRPRLMDANRAGHSARQAALPKTNTDDRARVRSHQAQPIDHQIPPQRPDRSAHRVAITYGNPQPDKAPPPPARRRHGLKTAPTRSHRQIPRDHSQPPAWTRVITRQPRDEALVSAALPRLLPPRRRRASATDYSSTPQGVMPTHWPLCTAMGNAVEGEQVIASVVKHSCGS